MINLKRYYFEKPPSPSGIMIKYNDPLTMTLAVAKTKATRKLGGFFKLSLVFVMFHRALPRKIRITRRSKVPAE